MVFEDDGGFVLAQSVRAYERLPFKRYGGEVIYGNYRVTDGMVEARAVGPGGDTNYERVVSTYRLTPTGPESYYLEYRYETPIYGDGELCHRQEYVLKRAIE